MNLINQPLVNSSGSNASVQNHKEDEQKIDQSKEETPKLYEDIIFDKLKNAKFPHQE